MGGDIKRSRQWDADDQWPFVVKSPATIVATLPAHLEARYQPAVVRNRDQPAVRGVLAADIPLG
jgi:hypothetical protein